MLQFENVLLYDDFTPVVKKAKVGMQGKFKLSQASNTASELNVLYTAVTRATHRLSLNSTLCDCISFVLERFHNENMTHHVAALYQAMDFELPHPTEVATSGESDEMPSSSPSSTVSTESDATASQDSIINGIKRWTTPVASKPTKQSRVV